MVAATRVTNRQLCGCFSAPRPLPAIDLFRDELLARPVEFPVDQDKSLIDQRGLLRSLALHKRAKRLGQQWRAGNLVCR